MHIAAFGVVLASRVAKTNGQCGNPQLFPDLRHARSSAQNQQSSRQGPGIQIERALQLCQCCVERGDTKTPRHTLVPGRLVDQHDPPRAIAIDLCNNIDKTNLVKHQFATTPCRHSQRIDIADIAQHMVVVGDLLMRLQGSFAGGMRNLNRAVDACDTGLAIEIADFEAPVLRTGATYACRYRERLGRAPRSTAASPESNVTLTVLPF